MILSATLKCDGEDGDDVLYVDPRFGGQSFLSGPVLVKKSALPDPPPALLRVEVWWHQPSAQQSDIEAEINEAAGQASFASGDRVQVVKSRTSGVQNPPEWLKQHLGKTGHVLWLTPGGANVDLDGEVVWFSFEELEKTV